MFGFVFGTCFVKRILMSFKICNYLADEAITRRFTLIVLLLLWDYLYCVSLRLDRDLAGQTHLSFIIHARQNVLHFFCLI